MRVWLTSKGQAAAMTTAGVLDAKTRLSELIGEVEAGGEVVITRRGEPVARLVPAERSRLSGAESLARLAALREQTARESPATSTCNPRSTPSGVAIGRACAGRPGGGGLVDLDDFGLASDPAPEPGVIAAAADHARAGGLSLFDGLHLELALRTEAVLATGDKRLLDFARRSGAAVYDAGAE